MKPTAKTKDVSHLSFGDLINMLVDIDKLNEIDLRWRMMLIQREIGGELKVGFRV